MDETEDHEPRVANVSETTAKLTPVVTTTSTETRIEEVVEGEGEGEGEGDEIEERHVSVSEKVVVAEEEGRACEDGDVMVEVLGSEVLFDGARRHNGEVGGVQRGGGVKGENLGDGDDGGGGGSVGAGKVDDSVVDEKRVVEMQVERGTERKSDDDGRVMEMELAGNGNEIQEGSVSHDVEVRRSNKIENGIQHSMSQITSMADGIKDDNAAESVDAEKEANELQSVKVVEFVSESKPKEEVIPEKGNEEGVSTPDTYRHSELTMGLSITESKVADRPVAGIPEADSDAGPSRDGNGESEGLVDHERPRLAYESPVRCIDEGLECRADASEGGRMEFIDGVKEQAANIEKVVLVGAPSRNEDEMIEPLDTVTSSPVDKQHVQVQSKVNKDDEKLNMGSILFEPEDPDVSVAERAAEGLSGSQKRDETEESESHSAHGQPPLPDESPVEVVDQVNSSTPDTLSVDVNAIEAVAWVGSNMEDIQEAQEDVDISEQVELPDVQEEDEELQSDSMGSQSNDGSKECEGHTAHGQEDEELQSDSMESQSDDGSKDCEGRTAHGQALVPDESVLDVDQANKRVAKITLVNESAMLGVAQDGSDMEDSQEGPEEAGITEEVESPDEPEVDEEPVSDSSKPRSKEEKNARRGHAKSGNLGKDHQVSYQLPPENEGEFSVFDLVWGKVKSHPWWPGQIFHPFDSSEKAKKYFRKDCYLVAYFGDKSFAWNDGSVLKPFFKNFSQEEKQSNSEAFQNAVNCAMEEVSRRVELGLACSCISEEVYDKIRYQTVENAGIREESSKREGVDWSTGVDYFQPVNLVEYIKALALSPTSGTSQLDLVIAKAQLLAFNRLKGCDVLPDFQYYDGLVECDAETPLCAEHGEAELVDPVAGGDGKARSKGPHRRKHNLKDIVYRRRKEKSMTELMGESMYYFDGDFDSHEEDDIMLASPTSGTKRKASSYLTDDFTGQQNTKTISVAKVSQTASPNPQQSFKVGECIRRVASQLTGSSSIMKITGDGSNSQHLVDDADEISDPPDDSLPEEEMAPKKEVSTDEMLSQLHLSARDPMKGYSFLADVISFFSEFRNLAVSTQRQRMRKGSGRKRKPSVPVTGAPETFEFDDRNDSYWTDMVIQNNSEAKPSRRGRKRKEERLPSGDPEKPLKSNPRKYSRKQYFHGNRESVAEVCPETEKQQEQLPTGPTELMLNFSEVGSIPSEVNLNKMFRRFGPLKESETEIDAQSCRAKVVFKKRSDAEVAYSSAAMFNIFGSTLVNYQLNYRPSAPFRSAPLALTDGQEDAT